MGQARKTQAGGSSASDASGAVAIDGSKPLDNMRWEKFCQLYAGKHFANGRQAYKEAGYNPKTDQSADVDACRLLKNDKVWERITYLREDSVRLLGVDRIQILKGRLHIATKDPSATPSDKLKAWDAIEKSLGLNEPDKKDIKLSGTIINIDFLDESDDSTETD